MKHPWGVRTVMAVGAMGAIVLHGIAPAAAANATEASCFANAINSARAAAGVPALGPSSALQPVAQSWSATMAAAGKIFHNTNLVNEAPSNWLAIGENVGMGPTCDSIAQAFMLSPEHKKNILDPAFSTMGVAVTDGSDGLIYVVEDFMGTGSSGVVTAPAPTVTTPAPKAPAPKATAPAPAPAPVHASSPAPSPKLSSPAPSPTTAAKAGDTAVAATTAYVPTVAVPIVDPALEPAPAAAPETPAPAPAPPVRHGGLLQTVVSDIAAFFSHLF